MGNFIAFKDLLKSGEKDKVRLDAKALILSTLRGLEPYYRGMLVVFLYKHNLLDKDKKDLGFNGC